MEIEKVADKKIKVFIVDDHLVVRTGVAKLLEENGMKVVAEAETGENFLKEHKKTDYDVLLLDLKLPGISGIEVLNKVIEANPKTKVVILTVYEEKEYVLAALKACAKGYVVKSADTVEIIDAIVSAYNNDIYLCKKINQVVLNELTSSLQDIDKVHEELTKREKEVLQLVGEGYTSKEIAAKLFISTRTVETHRENIMKKLKVTSVAGLVKYAVHKGMIEII